MCSSDLAHRRGRPRGGGGGGGGGGNVPLSLARGDGDFTIVWAPGSVRVWDILGFKLLASVAFGLLQSVLVDTLTSQYGWSAGAGVWSDRLINVLSLAASLAFAYNVETAAPLFVVLVAFLGAASVAAGLAALASLSTATGLLFVTASGMALVCSVAVHPWSTVLAADQLPKVSGQERSSLFVYSYTCMYLGVIVADAAGPWLLRWLGVFPLHLLALALLAAGVALLLRRAKQLILLQPGSHSLLGSVLAAARAVRWNLAPLTPVERIDVAAVEAAAAAGVSSAAGGSAAVVEAPTEHRWFSWVDRAAGRLPRGQLALARLAVLVAPVAGALAVFHALFGSVEFFATLHGEHAEAAASGAGARAAATALRTAGPCLGTTELQVVKAVYSLVMAPTLELIILPVLWSSEAVARPTPLRRMVLGAAVAIMVLLATALLHLLAAANFVVLGCIVQIMRTAVVVVAELMVGGAWVEFAYVCGAQESAAARAGVVGVLAALVGAGELASGALLSALTLVLPLSVAYVFAAAAMGALAVFLAPRAWPDTKARTAVSGGGAGSGGGGSGGSGGSEGVEPVTTHTSALLGEVPLIPGALPDEEHIPLPARGGLRRRG